MADNFTDVIKIDLYHAAKKAMWPLVCIFLLLVGLYLTSIKSFLLFHTLSEFFSVSVALAIFLIVFSVRKVEADSYMVVIGFSCLFIGILDILHVTAYQGMSIFNDKTSNLATQLWVCARFLQAASFAAAPFFVRRKINHKIVFTSLLAVFCVIIGSIFYLHIFPVCFIEGKGLTDFKKYSEYFICLLFLTAIALTYFKRSSFEITTGRLIALSLLFAVFSELIFTTYVRVYDTMNITGHYLKIVSFFILYIALVKSMVTNPLETIFREVKQNQDVLTKTLDFAKARTAEVSSLLNITTNILLSTSFEESAINILDKSAHLIGGTNGYIILNDDSSKDNCRVVARQGNSLFISDNSFIKFYTGRYYDTWASNIPFCDNGLAIPLVNGTVKNVISCALVIDGRFCGRIILLNKDGDFTKNDLRMLSSFCELCSIALKSFEITGLLRESEQRFESFMSNLPAGTYIKDIKGGYVYANKYFEETFCTSQPGDDAIVLDKFIDEVMEKSQRDDNSVFSTGKIIEKTFDVHIKGVEKSYMVKKFPVLTESKIYLLGGIALDITDSKNGERELLKAKEELEQRVQLRTVQLSQTVDDLQTEVCERLAAEKKLLNNQKRLRSLSQQLVLAEERQRRKFAVELHDSIGQLLAFAKKELGVLVDNSVIGTQKQISNARQAIIESIDRTRKLTFDLSSPTLYTLGLKSAIEEIAEELSIKHNYNCLVQDCEIPCSISEDIQVLLFRSIRELLLNVAKHADARNVYISVKTENDIIRVVVEDDGVGFNTQELNDGARKSYGLFSVRESLNNFGGKLEIGSRDDSGRGTRVVMYIPIVQEMGDEN